MRFCDLKQILTNTFLSQIPLKERLFSQYFLYVKAACKMLVKLIPGVNLIIILRALFCQYYGAKK